MLLSLDVVMDIFVRWLCLSWIVIYYEHLLGIIYYVAPYLFIIEIASLIFMSSLWGALHMVSGRITKCAHDRYKVDMPNSVNYFNLTPIVK